ncbi:protein DETOXIFICATION 49-like [Magnolia sinica]|uniref:protein DETOXIFICATION 49-like n=1 Tax=Magnolia sinica TaxID=86752 RepID=UPI00265821F0|nr:protein DETOXIFICATION 49-like [Magnolia sinica]
MENAATPPSTPLMIFAILPISDHNPHHHSKRWPSTSEVVEEIQNLYNIAFPMIITGLLLYGKAVISMLFMGRLGKDVLAGGSLAIGFANITGYSVLSGLAMGMEAISSQAYGAEQWSLMGHALQRTIMILLTACIPIALLWLKIEPILLYCGQDRAITAVASTYLAFSLPDLIFQSFLNPLKIYLRTQNITMPLTVGAALSLILHAPINYFLVCFLGLGIRGIALTAAFTDFNLLVALLIYLNCSGLHKKSWGGWSSECFCEWKPLLNLAIPSCISVCLEWWWYELMVIFSGLLSNATDAVAAMGILIQATSLVYIFPLALSLAVSTRVGNELGANRPDKARLSMQVSIFCAIFTGLVAMVFTTALRNVWGRAFTTDGAIISLTAMAMPIVGLCELGNCPQTTGCGALRGSARPSLGANINLGSFYGVGMPMAMAMGFVLNLGLLGLWLGLLAAQGTCALVMIFLLLRTDWGLQAKRARELMGGGDEGVYKGNIEEDVGNSPPYKIVESEEVEAIISFKVLQQ